MSKRVTTHKMFIVTLPAVGAFKEKKARAYIDPSTGDIYGSEKIIARLESKNDKAVESVAVVVNKAKELYPDLTDIKIRGKIIRDTRDSGRMFDKNNGSGSKLIFQLM